MRLAAQFDSAVDSLTGPPRSGRHGELGGARKRGCTASWGGACGPAGGAEGSPVRRAAIVETVDGPNSIDVLVIRRLWTPNDLLTGRAQIGCVWRSPTRGLAVTAAIAVGAVLAPARLTPAIWATVHYSQ